MTYALREAIFSKDYITIQDMEVLLGMGYNDAAKMIRDIKKALILNPKYNGQGVRLDIQGKLHVQDYLDYFNITDHQRYSPPSVVEAAEAEVLHSIEHLTQEQRQRWVKLNVVMYEQFTANGAEEYPPMWPDGTSMVSEPKEEWDEEDKPF